MDNTNNTILHGLSLYTTHSNRGFSFFDRKSLEVSNSVIFPLSLFKLPQLMDVLTEGKLQLKRMSQLIVNCTCSFQCLFVILILLKGIALLINISVFFL